MNRTTLILLTILSTTILTQTPSTTSASTTSASPKPPPVCIKGCVKCKDTTTCELCTTDSYFLEPKTKTCKKCSIDCNRCNSKSDCSSCIKGYYLDLPQELNHLTVEGATCQPCIGNCLDCKFANECDTCKKGFKYKSGHCLKTKFYETLEFYLFGVVFVVLCIFITFIACKCNSCKKERMKKAQEKKQNQDDLAKGLISGGESQIRYH